jgi:hypothetical protein
MLVWGQEKGAGMTNGWGIVDMEMRLFNTLSVIALRVR